MKKIFILTFSLFISFGLTLKSQNTFQKTISNPNDQVINQVIENDVGGFVFVGKIYDSETSKPGGYILEIDSTGNLLTEEIIRPIDTINYIFFNVHFYNNHYYILGSQTIIYPDTSKLWFLQLNSDLEIENEKFLTIPCNRWISYLNSIVDSDNNFVITGYTSRLDTNQNGDPIYNTDVFFYKLNFNGDSLTSHFYTSWVPIDHSFDIIESWDSSKYYAFVSHFTEVFGTSGQRLVLDKNLDSLTIDSIPLRVFDNYSPTYLNQNEILICGKGLDEYAPYTLNVLSITETCSLIDYGNFKKDPFKDYPSIYQGVSKNDDNIYVGGTSNCDYYNLFFSTFDSWFHLIKINPDISSIWENWYGGDAYYLLYSILATNDSGCIMVGNKYDYETQGQERDIYVVKVNNEGLIVWTQEIQPGETLFSIYPNPGNETLNINSPLDHLQVQLFDLTGRMECEAELSSGINSIPVSSLPAGIYLYRISDKKNQTVQTGKWIKN